MHASKNNVCPHVLPWLDDFACGVRRNSALHKFVTATLAKIKSFNLSRSTCLCTRFPSSQSVNVLDDKSSSVIDSKQLLGALRLLHEWKNNLELEFNTTYDLTFIDTWHVYGQLKREMEKFNIITNKYIIMHDTTVDEWQGETIRNGWNAKQQSKETGIPIDEINTGLWPAIEEFLLKNKDWQIKERFVNNNGLTVLQKQ